MALANPANTDFTVFDKNTPGTGKLGTLISNSYQQVRYLINPSPFAGINKWKFTLPGSGFSAIHYIVVALRP